MASRPARHQATGNAFVESFSRRFRDECLHGHLFGSVSVARRIIETGGTVSSAPGNTPDLRGSEPQHRGGGGGFRDLAGRQDHHASTVTQDGRCRDIEQILPGGSCLAA